MSSAAQRFEVRERRVGYEDLMLIVERALERAITVSALYQSQWSYGEAEARATAVAETMEWVREQLDPTDSE